MKIPLLSNFSLPSKKSLFYAFIGWILWVLFSGFIFKYQSAKIYSSFDSYIFSASIAIFNEIPFIFLSFFIWLHTKNLRLQEFLPLRLLLTHLVLAILYSALWITILVKINFTLGGYEMLFQIKIEDYIFWQFKEGVMKYVILIGIFYLVDDYKTFRQKEVREKELEISARESELKALKFQINPHFLFNALNSVNALLSKDTKTARKMLVTLSDFFRKTLEIKADELIFLEDEILLIKDYFEIEKNRFSDRLIFEFEITQEARQTKIPALILQPICENSIKHGISKLEEGGKITIKAYFLEKNLLINVKNPTPDFETKSSGKNGIGLENIKNRLFQFYGNKANLEVKSLKNEFEVLIKISL